MSDPNSRPRRTSSDFRGILIQSGFWSTCGYDGLSVVFDVPVDSIRSLSEGQKRALMRLLHRLAEGTDEELENEVAQLESVAVEDRFVSLVTLSAGFSA